MFAVAVFRSTTGYYPKSIYFTVVMKAIKHKLYSLGINDLYEKRTDAVSSLYN